MSKLDQALTASLQDESLQELYYLLLLDSDFYVPLQADGSDTPLDQRDAVQPLILESDGKHYLMLFDSEERLDGWAKKAIPFATLSGRLLASITPPNLHWAVNIGSTYAKEFVPDEISHLKSLTPAAGEDN